MTWDETTAELENLKTLFIHPEKSEEDRVHNEAIRKRCHELRELRYELAKALRP